MVRPYSRVGGRRLNWEKEAPKAFSTHQTHIATPKNAHQAKRTTTTTMEKEKKNHGCVTNSYRPVTRKSTRHKRTWPAETGRWCFKSRVTSYHVMLFGIFWRVIAWVYSEDGWRREKNTFFFSTGWIAGKGFLMLVDGKFPFSAQQSGGYLRSIVKSISPAAAVQSAWEEMPLWLKTDSRQKEEEVRKEKNNTSQPRPLLVSFSCSAKKFDSIILNLHKGQQLKKKKKREAAQNDGIHYLT